MQKSLKCSILTTLFLLLPITVKALPDSHDDHGPHAGLVQHNEKLSAEILEGKGALFVYLLDKNWGPLKIDAKNLNLIHVRTEAAKNQASPFGCEAQKMEGYKCTNPKGITLKSGDQIKLKVALSKGNETSLSFSYPFAPKAK